MKLLLFAALVALAAAQNLPEWVYVGTLQPSFAYTGNNVNNNDGNRGLILMTVNSASGAANVEVMTTLREYIKIAFYGPVRCAQKDGVSISNRNLEDPECIERKGDEILVVSQNQDDGLYHSFSYTFSTRDLVALNSGDYRFYVQVDTEVRPEGALRGYVGGINTNVPHIISNERFVSILRFKPNGGEFDGAEPTSSANTGFGYVIHDIGSDNGNDAYEMKFRLVQSIDRPGSLRLSCPNGGASIADFNQNTPEYLAVDYDFPVDERPALLSFLRPGSKCFLSISSGEFQVGELFSFPAHVGHFTAPFSGESGYTAMVTAHMDYLSNYLFLQIKHDIPKASLTNAKVMVGRMDDPAAAVEVCQIPLAALNHPDQDVNAEFTPPFGGQDACYVNGTFSERVMNNEIYIELSAGEQVIRGQLDPNGAALGATGGLPIGAIIGIIVGAVAVLLIVAIGIGAAVFMMNRGGSKI